MSLSLKRGLVPFPSQFLQFQLPLNSLFGILDLKLGSEILTLFLLLNKVAGVYGLLAVFFGGSVAQVSLYIYSIASIGVALWGLRVIGEENPAKVLLYSHLYTMDHLISSLFTLYFGVNWFKYTPHDGRREAKSAAQEEIIGGNDAYDGDDSERIRQAQAVWKDERSFAAAVLVAGWLLKIYFILVLYSLSVHLRRGTWRSLLASQLSNKANNRRTSQPGHITTTSNGYAYSHLRNTSTTSNAGMGGPGDLVWDGEGNYGPDIGDDADLDRQIRELESSPITPNTGSSSIGTSRKVSETGSSSRR